VFQLTIHHQIKPLTEEEKKAKLAELRQKLAEKRAAQSKDDVKANKANEVSSDQCGLRDQLTVSPQALRRKAGQVGFHDQLRADAIRTKVRSKRIWKQRRLLRR
jgi:hypothetical protein